MLSLSLGAVLSGCLATPDPPVGGASTASTSNSDAAKLRQVAQESERLRKERDRLKAQLSAQAKRTPETTKATKTTGTARRPPQKASGPATRPPRPAGASAGLPVSFSQLAARLGGSEGVAYASVGSAATKQLGSWLTGPGWSTVKVPLAVAAVARAQGHPDAGVRSLMRRAITSSDNAAAEQLWASLGTPPAAAARVQAVLRSAGDSTTRVQSQRVRPGFSAFGQTTWSLVNQAAFMAKLPCIKDSGDVLALMGQVESGQRWGIGSVGRPARFKGGWGPGPGGGYLVRQMGIVTLANGSQIALAIASQPADGRFATGTANLTALARWAVANLRTTGPAHC